jgi:hypothetical protein
MLGSRREALRANLVATVYSGKHPRGPISEGGSKRDTLPKNSGEIQGSRRYRSLRSEWAQAKFERSSGAQIHIDAHVIALQCSSRQGTIVCAPES